MSYFKTLWAKISDTVVRAARLDASTHVLLRMSHLHHELHAGNAFKIDHSDTGLAAGGEIGILFTTPNTTKWGHVFAQASCGTAANFEILEAPTLDTGNYPTTFRTILNRNRNSNTESVMVSVRASPVANQASIKLAGDVTPISGDGTAIHSEAFGATKNDPVVASTRDEGEYVFKKNTTYYFRLKGDGTGSGGVASMHVSWYEHVDRD